MDYKLIKKELSIYDKFVFNGNIKFHKYKNVWLAVSIETANWIVLKSLFQKRILILFINGKNIDFVLKKISNEKEHSEFIELLSIICSRNFGYINKIKHTKNIKKEKKISCCLTTSCNLRCKHCYMSAGNELKNELKFEEWKNILDQFKEENGTHVTFTGGEPLMKTFFLDLVKYAYDLGFHVAILSNGTLLDEYKISFLSRYIDKIQISIDGFDARSNYITRGNMDFDKIVNAVISFSNKGVITYVATTFTFENLNNKTSIEYEKLVNYINSKCNNKVIFRLTKKMLKGRYINYSEKENEKYNNKILKIENKINPNSFYINFIRDHNKNVVTDNCGFGGVEILSNGNIYFCNRFSDLECYGNIRKNKLKYFIEKGEEINKKTSCDNIEPCKKCDFKYICGGGCRIDDFNFNGKLKNFKKEILQTTCNSKIKNKLKESMIKSFEYYYKF